MVCHLPRQSNCPAPRANPQMLDSFEDLGIRSRRGLSGEMTNHDPQPSCVSWSCPRLVPLAVSLPPASIIPQENVTAFCANVIPPGRLRISLQPSFTGLRRSRVRGLHAALKGKAARRVAPPVERVEFTTATAPCGKTARISLNAALLLPRQTLFLVRCRMILTV